jgi:hypothetical protein
MRAARAYEWLSRNIFLSQILLVAMKKCIYLTVRWECIRAWAGQSKSKILITEQTLRNYMLIRDHGKIDSIEYMFPKRESMFTCVGTILFLHGLGGPSVSPATNQQCGKNWERREEYYFPTDKGAIHVSPVRNKCYSRSRVRIRMQEMLKCLNVLQENIPTDSQFLLILSLRTFVDNWRIGYISIRSDQSLLIELESVPDKPPIIAIAPVYKEHGQPHTKASIWFLQFIVIRSLINKLQVYKSDLRNKTTFPD